VVTKAKPTTKTAAKASPKTKAPAKAAKSGTKTPTEPPAAAKRQNKRKAEEEVEEEQPKVNGVKRHRTKSATPAPAPTKRQAAGVLKRVPAAKKPKVKVVINQAPTQRLNVYVFGEGSSGELGLGSAKGSLEVKRPRLNNLLDADTVGVVHLAVGGMHTAALTHDNKILTWGVNDQGALGRDTAWEGGLRDIDDDDSDSGSSESDDEPVVNPKESTPSEVDVSGLPEDVVFTQLTCTDSATFALTDEGLVYGWGTFRVSGVPRRGPILNITNVFKSNEGLFGFNSSTLIQTRPTLIEELKHITKIVGGANHVLALQNNGAVYAWGSGQQNQLGRRILERTKLHSLKPTQFGLPKKMVNIGVGSYHSFAIHQNGDVYSWGLNSFGETGIAKDIGEGGESDVHHPTVIDGLRGRGKVTCIEGGAHHTVAVTDQGELLVWGRLDGCQLGLKLSTLPEDHVIRDSHDHPRILTVPTQIPGIDAVYATAGSDHCIAVDKGGKAYAWGFSTTYQTGLGTDDDVEVATQIDNTAVRGKKLVWAGAGGQFSVIAGIAGEETTPKVNGINGHL